MSPNCGLGVHRVLAAPAESLPPASAQLQGSRCPNPWRGEEEGVSWLLTDSSGPGSWVTMEHTTRGTGGWKVKDTWDSSSLVPSAGGAGSARLGIQGGLVTPRGWALGWEAQSGTRAQCQKRRLADRSWPGTGDAGGRAGGAVGPFLSQGPGGTALCLWLASSPPARHACVAVEMQGSLQVPLSHPSPLLCSDSSAHLMLQHRDSSPGPALLAQLSPSHLQKSALW